MIALKNLILLSLFAISVTLAASANAADSRSPIVRLITSEGDIDIELNRDRAPLSVENFLRYVREGFYNDTIFHRVIPGFMIQGGGFESGLERKETHKPIRNEADNGLKNRPGTIAMARTSDPHSATSQFFINTVDNKSLDYRSKTANGWGYAVFGRVIKGLDVVKKIESEPTGRLGNFNDVPDKEIFIIKAEIERD